MRRGRAARGCAHRRGRAAGIIEPVKPLAPRRRRALLLVACGAAGLQGSGCAPGLDWREVRPADTALVMWMPCRPAHETRELPLGPSTLRWGVWACEAGGQTWGLGSGDVGDPARVAPALSALREQAAAQMGAASAPGRALAVPGATPLPGQASIRVAGRLRDGRPGQAQVMVFARGTRVYQATVIGERLDEEAVRTFAEALRFVP